VATIAVWWLKVPKESAAETLRNAGEKLQTAEGELVLDFSGLCRIDPGAIEALKRLAATAEARDVKVGLRGVNVGIYKVLKLAKLTPRFSFLT